MFEFIKRNKILFGLAVFVMAILYVFFPVLGRYDALNTPDSSPFFVYEYSYVMWSFLLEGIKDFTPQRLYWLTFDPLHAHDLSYMIDTFVLTLAGVYYLRGRKVSALAAWCGGLALGFSGYTFTLFCAGHRDYFHMFSTVVWSFGLIDRCFRLKKLFHFGMLGLVIAWGIGGQPDILILAVGVAALYALWLSFVSGEGIKESAVKVWPRFIVSVLILGLAGYSGMNIALTKHLGNRQKQIASVGGVNKVEPNSATKASKSEVEKEKKAQWIFATNWSLPPEDVLEFIVPGVFGNQSFRGDHPYWGRLGQPHKDVFQKGRMMPNYRQHTVYFGVISFVLSLFAIMVWFSVRKLPLSEESDDDVRGVYRDVPFWCFVWCVFLLLAMGRYTPLYRLFYAIPYMDMIRAPVKFLHLVEVASALLCGFGAHALLSRHESFERCRKRFVLVLVSFVIVLGVVALSFSIGKTALASHIKELGSIRFSGDVAGYSLHNIGRSILFLIPLGVFWFVYRKSSLSQRASFVCGVGLVALIAVDQVSVAKRYVNVIDLKPYYHENVVIKALKKDCPDAIPRVLNYAESQANDWLKKSLKHNGIINMVPQKPDSRYAKIFAELQSSPQRLWQVFDVKYLILPYKAAESLVRSKVAKPLLVFNVRPGVVRSALQPSEESLALLSLVSAKNQPRLLTVWRGGVAVDEQLSKLKSSDVVITDADAPKQVSEGSASLKKIYDNGIPSAYSVAFTTSCDSETLLVYDWVWGTRYEHLIDGKVVQGYTANGVLDAVKVPAGEHKVALRRKRNYKGLILSLLAVFVVVGLGFADRCVCLIKRRDAVNQV